MQALASTCKHLLKGGPVLGKSTELGQVHDSPVVHDVSEQFVKT